jgi:hypothetical protein
MAYDCTQDVLKHRYLVKQSLEWISVNLRLRAVKHDLSKLDDPIEKAMYDEWTPQLRVNKFGSDQYKIALDSMGEGISRHYQNNRHHPEHFPDGIDGMSLIDLVEMLCDWVAVCRQNGSELDLDHAQKRFGMSDQTRRLLQNTWEEMKGSLL